MSQNSSLHTKSPCASCGLQVGKICTTLIYIPPFDSLGPLKLHKQSRFQCTNMLQVPTPTPEYLRPVTLGHKNFQITIYKRFLGIKDNQLNRKNTKFILCFGCFQCIISMFTLFIVHNSRNFVKMTPKLLVILNLKRF